MGMGVMDRMEELEVIAEKMLDVLKIDEYIFQSDFIRSFDEYVKSDVLFTLGILIRDGYIDYIESKTGRLLYIKNGQK